MPDPKPRRKQSCLLTAVLALVGLCVLLALASSLTNLLAPEDGPASSTLTALDKLRLEETLHLRQTLGGEILPGWDQADIPLIVYNQDYLFLVGLADPPAGWRKLPQGAQLGAEWEPVAGDDFLGRPYYRQRCDPAQGSTEAFTVQIGDRWAASLGTFEYMRASLAGLIRDELPSPLDLVIPYRLYVRVLLPGSDAYIGALLHESVHAYQGARGAGRLLAAERLYLRAGEAYPADDEAFRQAWQAELDLLNQALRAGSPEETAALAGQFLARRAERRAAAGLSADMIALEQMREWEEGLAKYGELSSLLLAASSPGYEPIPALEQDGAFGGYAGARQKWDQEVQQIRRMAADDGDTRFYYSGFAQAALLDRLSPGWKARWLEDNVWLEDLLAQAVAGAKP